MRITPILLSLTWILAVSANAWSATLEVGPGRTYDRLESAVKAASDGDQIVVYANRNKKPYERTAVLVRTPNLTIRAAKSARPVVLDGSGFDYSGSGSTPRAIIQFDPQASGGTLEGFELRNARNESNNAAGVRINQANRVTIRNCHIHSNDMGIMSNGDFAANTGAEQLIENCTIVENGSEKDPGYNHNLYLGGHSATVRKCEIARSVTGHNLKSRAHSNIVTECNIHDAANRELDFVDAPGTTDVPGSDAVLMRNVIAKAPDCPGNHGVIPFGKDGSSTRIGTLRLEKNRVWTPFSTPIIDISSGNVALRNNSFQGSNPRQSGTILNLRSPESKVTESQNKYPEAFRMGTK